MESGWIVSGRAGITKHFYYPAHLPAFKPDFNPVRVSGRAREDLLHNSPGFPAGPLVFFLDDIHRASDGDRGTVLPTFIYGHVWFSLS